MPLFEFVCRDCRRSTEILIRGSETPRCAHCGSKKLDKMMGHFAPLGSSAHKRPCEGCSDAVAESCPMGGGCFN
jgi:putative FmdB family regulatory protein